ncbi:MAG: hypothetical protein RIS73_2080 [Bacteroidota bacterium]|jgi:hypothetical protein
MTRLEKLEATNKEVQELEINNDLGFFTRLFPEKMNTFLNLTFFNDIDNPDFQYYLLTFREDVANTIAWCKESKLNETDWQKKYTINHCKKSISDMLYYTRKAVEYYLGSEDLLLKDEN